MVYSSGSFSGKSSGFAVHPQVSLAEIHCQSSQSPSQAEGARRILDTQGSPCVLPAMIVLHDEPGLEQASGLEMSTSHLD